MTWLLWRQHRGQALTATIAYAAFGILLWITGVHMAHTYHAALATCQPSGTCGELSLFRGDGAIIDLVNFSIALPLLMGLFWGVTAIGREFESGTHQLVWMQSVRRQVWLRGKITTVLIAALLWTAAVSAVVTWWSGTLNSLEANRFDSGKFDVQGIVPLAYALFGVSLGLAAGALLRRVLPALAVTVAVFVAARLAIATYLRPHYESARTVVTSLLHHSGELPSGSWMLKQTVLLNGKPVPDSFEPPAACRLATRTSIDTCLAKHGVASQVSYQPASRYWPFQWIEAGIFVALAAALIVTMVLVVRRRDA